MKFANEPKFTEMFCINFCSGLNLATWGEIGTEDAFETLPFQCQNPAGSFYTFVPAQTSKPPFLFQAHLVTLCSPSARTPPALGLPNFFQDQVPRCENAVFFTNNRDGLSFLRFAGIPVRHLNVAT